MDDQTWKMKSRNDLVEIAKLWNVIPTALLEQMNQEQLADVMARLDRGEQINWTKDQQVLAAADQAERPQRSRRGRKPKAAIAESQGDLGAVSQSETGSLSEESSEGTSALTGKRGRAKKDSSRQTESGRLRDILAVLESQLTREEAHIFRERQVKRTGGRLSIDEYKRRIEMIHELFPHVREDAPALKSRSMRTHNARVIKNGKEKIGDGAPDTEMKAQSELVEREAMRETLTPSTEERPIAPSALDEGQMAESGLKREQNADLELDAPYVSKGRGRYAESHPGERKPSRAAAQADDEMSERVERGDRGDDFDRSERPYRGERFERHERERQDSKGRSERSDRTERLERRDWSERPDRYVKAERKERYLPDNEEDADNQVTGVLEIMPEGYGFLRLENYLPSPNDIYLPPQYIRRFGLRTGDLITGPCRQKGDKDRYRALYYIKSVNGAQPDQMQRRPHFNRLTPIYPDQRYVLETERNELSTRIIDLIAPIGKGQRGMIVSPPKAGKTILLQKIANAISKNNPSAKLIVLLIDERPEEVTDMQRSIQGEVVYSTFDKTPENHVRLTELVLERAMRLVELGEDVVILLDSITRMGRAYNLTITPTGRTLSGGLDPGALNGPKRFFGAARNIEGGGSLTILATALVETGSRMDEVIFEEFKGTGNMEVYLDRKLSEKRIFPAIDITRSGTRREELLLTRQELEAVWAIRKAFGSMETAPVTETIINLMLKTRNNEQFIGSVNVSFNDKAYFEAMRGAATPAKEGGNSH